MQWVRCNHIDCQKERGYAELDHEQCEGQSAGGEKEQLLLENDRKLAQVLARKVHPNEHQHRNFGQDVQQSETQKSIQNHTPFCVVCAAVQRETQCGGEHEKEQKRYQYQNQNPEG